MWNKLWSVMAGAFLAVAGMSAVTLVPPLALIVLAPPVEAQPYPTNSPFYIPTAILGAQTITPAVGSSYVYQVNGQGTLYMRIAGVPSGLSATVQATEGRATQAIAQTLTSFTQANPGVFTLVGHGLSVNQPIVFTSAQSTLPTLIVSGTTYYVIATGFSSSTFELAATPGGTGINTTAGSPSGTVTFSSTSLLWSNMAVDTVGGYRVNTITGTGLYRINVSGAAAVRLNVAALTSGATTVEFSASPGSEFVRTNPMVRSTYRAYASIATGATSNFMTIFGSATKNVIISHIECSGRATAAIVVGITVNKQSAVDTGDAGTAVTATPVDSGEVAATATVLSHTTSPTPGASVGAIASGQLGIVLAAPTATDFPSPIVLAWDFGNRPGAALAVLHGVAEGISLSTSSAFGTAAAVTCGIEFQED